MMQKSSQEKERATKRFVLHVASCLLALLLVLGLYIAYLQTFGAEKLAHHPLNQRSAQAEAEVQRGSILDAKGRALAQSTAPGERTYPMGAALAPVTGYIGERIGSAGIEGRANQDLLGRTEEMNRLGPVSELLQADRGNDVHLTINADVQQAAYDAFAGRRGAAVVLDATTGAVLAMVSCPSYDPASVEANWDSLSQQADGALLNRVLYGMYPPGSTIKPMMADAALAEGVTDETEIFDCDGQLDVGGGQTIRESHGEVHGKVNLEKAITESCNVTFGTLAMRLGGKKLGTAFERFGFTKELTGDLASESAHLPDFKSLGQGDMAQVGIGQSSLLVTPMEMALLASAFANHGTVMEPYIVQSVVTPSGLTVREGTTKKWFDATTPERAALIDSYMEKVVTQGTGTAARVSGIRVTGKTGTAENAQGKDHAWFIGSADVGGRKIAFAIIVENSGGGGIEAAPIARKIVLSME
ncbi:MAG: penicillin-binding transpeptidase domain-containing protein [Veillonellaceae bacterium]|nr:penicillin-binding transpeptidase domain-containing protein [Veillonellaceae bacterium]